MYKLYKVVSKIGRSRPNTSWHDTLSEALMVCKMAVKRTELRTGRKMEHQVGTWTWSVAYVEPDSKLKLRALVIIEEDGQ